MKREKKYEELIKNLLENFSTTTNINDRLHTRDIVEIAHNNKFLFAD